MPGKGSVLIVVLIIISVSLAMSIGVMEMNTQLYHDVNNAQNMAQSEIYAFTLAKTAFQIIAEDKNGYDSHEDLWANEITYPLENGYVSAIIRPVNSKADLNLFSNYDNDTEKRLFDTAEKLYQEWSLPIELFHKIGDYIDNDSKSNSFGNEIHPYSVNGRTIQIKNKTLDTLQELRVIFGEEPAVVEYSKIFTAGSGEKKININFASEDVIKFYLPELGEFAPQIIDYRKNKPFKDISSIRNAISIENSLYQKLIPFITVKSENFYLKITIDNFGNLLYYHALINRNDGVKLLFEGNNEDYF